MKYLRCIQEYNDYGRNHCKLEEYKSNMKRRYVREVQDSLWAKKYIF